MASCQRGFASSRSSGQARAIILIKNLASRASRLHVEIEGDFLAASKNPALVQPLGQKLQRLHLFNEYEDRFFSLVKASKRK